MPDTITNPAAPAEWIEVLDESDADIAAGRIVPGHVVIDELRESLARLEAADRARALDEAAARR